MYRPFKIVEIDSWKTNVPFHWHEKKPFTS